MWKWSMIEDYYSIEYLDLECFLEINATYKYMSRAIQLNNVTNLAIF